VCTSWIFLGRRYSLLAMILLGTPGAARFTKKRKRERPGH
jgi:hypothetical protein